jgi:hypothetical protein
MRKKRSNREIVEKAVPSAFHLAQAEIARNGVWLPVSLAVYDKIKELLAARKVWVLTILPFESRNERAIVITDQSAKDALS